jgi:hypothetical protein
MNESIFLLGLTITLFAGLYFVKTLVHTSVVLIKVVFQFFEH